MELPLFSTYDPYPLLLSLARHNFDFLEGIPIPTSAALPSLIFYPAVSENYIFKTDSHFQVESFSFQASNFFGPILDSRPDFSLLLAPESAVLLEAIKSKAMTSVAFNGNFQLTFMRDDQVLLPALCSISRMLREEKLALNVNIPDFPASFLKNDIPLEAGAQRAKALHDYIHAHLDQPLPTLKELSVLFGTSLSVLKTNYRNCFHTSIYRSYSEARLQQAMRLLKEGIPPKEAAFSCGFQNYAHFLKAFKKRFGLLPSIVNRR